MKFKIIMKQKRLRKLVIMTIEYLTIYLAQLPTYM